MELLVGRLEVHYLVANLITIGCCSLVNFVVSDRVVFRDAHVSASLKKEEKKMTKKTNLSNRVALLIVVLAMGMASSPVMAAKLQEKTLKAWNQYVRLTEERITEELNSSTGFLAQDFQTVPKAQMERDAALSGQILVEKMKTLNPSGRKIKVPAGTIHHWRGSVFIPDVELESVLAQVRYPAQQKDLQKDVLESRILEESNDSLRLYLKLVRSKIVTVTYNTEHLIEYQRHGEGLASSRSIATKIARVRDRPEPLQRGKSRKDRTVDSCGN